MDPGYDGTQSGALSEVSPIFTVPSGLFTSRLADVPSPLVVKVDVLPFSSVISMAFLCGSNFMVTILPVFLLRTTIVPALSSLDTISTSGFMATAIFAPAYPGFFFINSESNPACFILCMA